MTCPKCNEKFQAEKAELYECPKCGTNIRPKKAEPVNLEATQKFHL